ncbi:MAG: hypothetical protein ABR574_02900 [Cryomorphaceae bacterium]|nr:hypothetical protein [Flavobacteriales bacterium]
MKTKELIKAMQKLPVSKRLYVIERSMHLIRKENERNAMETAAAELTETYRTDKELTAFTSLDFENFYEAR